MSLKISTNSLRRYLQRRYLSETQGSQTINPIAPSTVDATTAAGASQPQTFIEHNTIERNHKLLNIVYVLDYKNNATVIPLNSERQIDKDDVGSDANRELDADPPLNNNNNNNNSSVSPIVVLLGHKARGFGKGNWNGFGGKVDVGTDATITSSAIRELEEEVGLTILNQSACRHVGIMFYQYPFDGQQQTFEVQVYCVNGSEGPSVVSGTPTESEEMNPVRWFEELDIPLESMWSDDPLWLPQLLSVVMRPFSASSGGDDNDNNNNNNKDNCVSPSTHISNNIDNACFVGYVDFVTMSEVRGSCVLIGSENVRAACLDIFNAMAEDAPSIPKEMDSNPLTFFENDVVPIH